MTKEQIGKEIKELIRSIKTHYTFVEDEDRIPLIELELITSKIRKLYEKSIINNYLHSNDESYMSKERSSRFGEKRSFEKNAPDTLGKNSVNQVADISIPAIEPIKTEKSNEVQLASPVIPENNKEETLIATSDNSNSRHMLKDLKLLIGINDKFLLINNLFARNDADYKVTLEQLSCMHTYSEAQNFVASLVSKYSWNVESFAYVRFLQIIEKRYN